MEWLLLNTDHPSAQHTAAVYSDTVTDGNTKHRDTIGDQHTNGMD